MVFDIKNIMRLKNAQNFKNSRLKSKSIVSNLKKKSVCLFKHSWEFIFATVECVLLNHYSIKICAVVIIAIAIGAKSHKS